MKICIISDSHDHAILMDKAVAEAKEMGAEVVLHCGDVVAPSTMKHLIKHSLPIHFIHGNNTGDLYTLGHLVTRHKNLLHYYGMDASIEVADRRIFIVHYPHYAHAMAVTGDWDLVCCGHNHCANQEQVINIKGTQTILVNPGTVGGVGNAPATYILGDLDKMEFVIKYLPKQI